MKIKRNPLIEEQLLDKLMSEIEEDRSEQYPGVTQLIQCITKTYWERTSGQKPSLDRTTKLFFTTGLGLERALLTEQKVEGSLSGELDGVFYHIDGLIGDGVAEMKSTRMGIRQKIDREAVGRKLDNYRDIQFTDYPDKWQRQLKAYCHIKGVDKGYLVALHVIQPELLVWEVDFSPEELVGNWEYLKQRKQVLDLAHQYNRPPMPFQYNEDWECKNCPFMLMCTVYNNNVA